MRGVTGLEEKHESSSPRIGNGNDLVFVGTDIIYLLYMLLFTITPGFLTGFTRDRNDERIIVRYGYG